MNAAFSIGGIGDAVSPHDNSHAAHGNATFQRRQLGLTTGIVSTSQANHVEADAPALPKRSTTHRSTVYERPVSGQLVSGSTRGGGHHDHQYVSVVPALAYTKSVTRGS